MTLLPSRILLVSALALSLAVFGGCSKKTVDPYTPQAGKNMPEGTQLETGSGTVAGTISEESLAPEVEPLDAGSTQTETTFAGDQNSDEYKKKYGRSSPQMQPIYFNFDQSTIRNDQIPRIEQNAQYLKDNPSSNVVIEGNCDQQGTNEYNLALGERRAMNAKRYMVELGIDEFRIRTISYGEERPLFTGDNEEDYARNRRDDFVLE